MWTSMGMSGNGPDLVMDLSIDQGKSRDSLLEYPIRDWTVKRIIFLVLINLNFAWLLNWRLY